MEGVDVGLDTGPDGDDGGTMDTGTADSGGGGGDAEAGATLDCMTYCTAVAANCTGGNAQYQNTAECLAACAFFPVGTASDTTGDTLGCRTYHAGLAMSAPVPHCWHAGPFGFGACGAQCEDFCLLATSYCSAEAGYAGPYPYASLTDCTTQCPTFMSVAGADGGPAVEGGYYANGPATGNTRDCREYHLGNALVAPANRTPHCTHISPVPVVDGGGFPCK
jgi:hypothetical protein